MVEQQIKNSKNSPHIDSKAVKWREKIHNYKNTDNIFILF